MNPLKLWYRRPATHFNEALPLGNGRLGGMFYGGVAEEIIHLNDDTLWSGQGAPAPSVEAAAALPDIRKRLFAGDYAAAQRLIEETMLGPFTQSYLPAGDLVLTMMGEGFSGYHRELDLEQAIGRVAYATAAGRIEREMFCSAPHQLFAMKVTAESPGTLNFRVALRSQLRHECHATADGIELRGQCPVEALWPPVYGNKPPAEPIRYDSEGETRALRFAIALKVLSGDGKIETDGTDITFSGGSEATVLLAIATSFRHADPAATCREWLVEAPPYAGLRAAHIDDHQRLFHRVSLTLGSSEEIDLPTDERLCHYSNSPDPALEGLLFHYGRYLLIASSRAGTQPANLQGIWNPLLDPPWWSNLTLNINAEMNYWLAEVCHLAECHEPLLALASELATEGSRTARVQYRCRGWVAHHQTDLWRLTTPVGWMRDHTNFGAALYAMWPMSGAWICRHLWEHFLFSGHESFLRQRAWPIMKGAAEFYLDWLVEDSHGNLVTAPSTSPENRFRLPNGDVVAVCVGSAMDRSLLRELFSHVLSAGRIVGSEEAFCSQVEASLKRLPPLQIGKLGQVLEWDKEWEEVEPRHRHVSHLYGLYPAAEIDSHQTPDLASAARRSLDLRCDSGTGWSLAWKINLRARLGDGERAHSLIRQMLTMIEAKSVEVIYEDPPGGVYPNLLCAHPPFQIDGNFGTTSGIAEMLVQSHRRDGERWIIDLLPALPEAWQDGQFSGLRARGGFEVAAAWRDGRLQSATVLSTRGGPVRIRLGKTSVDFETEPGSRFEVPAT